MADAKRKAASLQLTARDIVLLRGLFESRVMTARHIATLFFEDKGEYAKKRLQKMKAAGLVGERRQQVNEPGILFLTRKGYTLLESQGHLSELPTMGKNSFEARINVSQLTLRHEMAVMDVKAAFHRTLASSEKFSLSEFSTWPLLYQFELPSRGFGKDRPVKPDGFIRIHEKEENTRGFFHDCFLEVDRSSKDQGRLVQQACCYLDYYRSGGFAVRNGVDPSAFKDYPFRVLIVLKSAERRNITAERLAQNNPPILTQAWLTTLAEVTANPLGAIWMLPGDYRNLVKDTKFYKESPNLNSPYLRSTERDAYVEANLQKRCLLEGGAV